MWGAKVYRGERPIGSITRLFINKETGAIDCFEIAQRIGRPPLFVRWEQLCFNLDPLRINMVGEADVTVVRKQSISRWLLQLPSFWGGG